MERRPQRGRGRGHPLSTRHRLRRALLAAASALYALVLGALTLTPSQNTGGGILADVAESLAALPGFGWVTFSGVEFTANIVLFVPLGVLLVAWWGRRGAAWAPLAGLATSAAIETIQGLCLAGRVADPRDLLSNTLGAVIGAGIVLTAGHVARRRRADPAREHASSTPPS